MAEKVEKSEAEWREQLSPEQYQVLRQKGTERAFTGKYWDNHEPGGYRCAGCGAELFRSDEYPQAFVQFNHSFSRANVLRGLHYHQHQAEIGAAPATGTETDSAPTWAGLADNDNWQTIYFTPGPEQRELNFWLPA